MCERSSILSLSDIVKEAVEGSGENDRVEFKAVLPPSRKLAQLISSFANSQGGVIVLGVQEMREELVFKGLSSDFHVSAIIYKALDYLSEKPRIEYGYVAYNEVSLYGISVEKSEEKVRFEGKIYIRENEQIIEVDKKKNIFNSNGYSRIKEIDKKIEENAGGATQAKENVIEHYKNVLKLLDDLGSLIYPESHDIPSSKAEGLVLSRIIFSSVVDNFETYLSDLLYEIYLAVPMTLKSKEQVTLEEVLACPDMQEFVSYYAKKKINKLQKGSVKGFIQDNKQIDMLGVFDKTTIDKVEGILQIRHLYSHRNGMIDEKFFQYYPSQDKINTQHKMSIAEICDIFVYLIAIIDKVDEAASCKYKLG